MDPLNNLFADSKKEGIQPFPESPSVEKSKVGSKTGGESGLISAAELFSLFTADVIKENLEFRR